MIDLLLTIFRYIFLAALLIFIFQLIKMIFKDLKPGVRAVASPTGSSQGKRPELLPVPDITPLPGAVAGLVVLGSSDPGVPAGKVYPVKNDDEISFGRGGRNTIILTDPFASVDHAAVFGRDGQFWLEDRGSKNGTHLNDIRIGSPTVLADGDRLRIGDVTMQFVRWSYEVESGNRSRPHKEAKRG